MSTKIYNGLRFVSTDLYEIHQQFMDWRKRIHELTDEYENKMIALKVVQIIDRQTIIETDEPIKNPMSHVWNEITDAQQEIKKTGRRQPAVDFDFEVSLMPHKGRVYGIVFCEQGPWVREFMAQNWVEEFGYWNNTDPPEDMDEAEWDIRGEIWNDVLQNKAPAQVGFTASCTRPYSWPSREAVLAAIPSLDDRVRYLAKDIVFARKSKELYPKDVEPKKIGFEWLFRTEDYLKSDEGKAEIAEEAKRIEPLLKRELTVVDILGWDPEEK